MNIKRCVFRVSGLSNHRSAEMYSFNNSNKKIIYSLFQGQHLMFDKIVFCLNYFFYRHIRKIMIQCCFGFNEKNISFGKINIMTEHTLQYFRTKVPVSIDWVLTSLKPYQVFSEILVCILPETWNNKLVSNHISKIQFRSWLKNKYFELYKTKKTILNLKFKVQIAAVIKFC